MNVVELPLNTIAAGPRLRGIDHDYVDLIAASFERDGQRTPIEVRRLKTSRDAYQLIAGGHRLEAASRLGMPTIFAIVLPVSDLEAQLLEVDENLMRHELTVLDRSVFLARRKELWEQLHPETKHGGDRRSDQVGRSDDLIQRFTAEAAEKLQISESVVQRAVRRFERLAPDVRRELTGTWLSRSGSQLDQLGKLPGSLQMRVVRAIVERRVLDDVRDVAAIVRQIDGTPDPSPATAFEKFLGLWRRASNSERAQIHDFIAAEGGPSEAK